MKSRSGETEAKIINIYYQICTRFSLCLAAALNTTKSCNKYGEVREECFDHILFDALRNYDKILIRQTGKIGLSNDLIAIFELLRSLSLVIDYRLSHIPSHDFDIFGYCFSIFIGRFNDGRLTYDEKNSLAKEFFERNSERMLGLSIDGKIDYYLEHMAKYREEMIKESGGSLVNVLKARMEQLDSTDVVKEEQKSRTGR